MPKLRKPLLAIAILTGFAMPLISQSRSFAASLLDMALGSTINESIDRATSALDQISKQRIEELINASAKLSKELIQQGANEGRLALVQAGNEMQIAIGVARSQFGKELQDQIGNASAQLRPILIEIQRWRQDIDDLKQKTFELEDLVAMDLGRLPLSPDYFGIRRITGTTLVQGAALTYNISVSGDNFGTTVVGQSISIAATLDSTPLPPPEKPGAPEKVVFRVPAAMVAGRFKPDEMVTVPLHITVKRMKDNWILGSWWPKTTILEHDLNVALPPELVGELVLQTTRPVYDWVSNMPATEKRAIDGDTSINFPNLPAQTAVSPEEGNQRYEEPIEATCGPVTQNAWILADKTVVLDSDPLIQKGWFSSSWVGEPEPPSWSKYNQEALAKFGWTPNFSNNNRCPAKSRCTLSPEEIKAHSKATTIPIEDCARMRMAEVNLTNKNGSLVVWIRGKVDHLSQWTVKAPISTYQQIDTKIEEQRKLVYASRLVWFDIPSPSRKSSIVQFYPKNGVKREDVLQNSIIKGPQYINEGKVGSATRYFYKYEYDKNVFSAQ